MQNKIKDKVNKLLWFYLFLNPFLDIISGTYIYIRFKDLLDVFEANIGITPSLFVRMLMLLVFVVYIIALKDKKSILAVLPMGLAFVLSVVAEYMALHSVGIMADLQYFAKFCYNVAVILVYGNYFKTCGYSRDELYEKLHRMFCIVTFFLAAGIIIPYICDFGFYTYADRFGYRGFRGVYYSGNDITAALMLIMPITCCKFLSMSGSKPSHKDFFFYGLAPVISNLCLLVIGTKTAYLAVIITFIITLVYAFYRKKQDKQDETLKYLLYIVIGVLLTMGLLSLLAWRSVFSTIVASFMGFSDAAEESTKTLVFSNRQNILKTTIEQYKDGGVVTWLFGLGRGSQEKVIEMDVFEVLFYYGVFGVVTMLWLYVKLGVAFVVKFFKGINFDNLGAFIALGICACYLVMAGHVLFSVTSGFYFSFVLIYADYFLVAPKQADGGEVLPA